MKKKHYLTEEGLEKIKAELDRLKKERKKRTKGDIPDVLHSEDLNQEYLDFRQQIELLEKRISKLEEVVKNAKVIKIPKNQEKVQLGAKVTVEANGKEDEFVIVGSLEADPSNGRISNMSPVGKALMGSEKGSEVEVSSPGKTVYKIKNIQY